MLWWIDLTQTKLKDGDPLQLHVNQILKASRKLMNAQFAIPEQVLTIVLLSSLPPSWDTVVTTLHTNLTATTGADRQKVFTLQFVIERLLNFEKMQTICKGSGGAALTASGKKKSTTKTKTGLKQCSNC